MSHRVEGNGKLMVILPPALVESFFTPTINNIIDCLQRIKTRPTLSNLHRVFLVGGFSSCRLLQRVVRLELERPGCSVVAVNFPEIAIAKGAVMFSTRSTIFNSRKARLTYGVQCSTSYDGDNPEHRRRHAAGKILQASDGEKCTSKFDLHISINDDIPMNGGLSTRTYFAVNESQKEASIPIFVSARRTPTWTDEGDCFKLGGIDVPFDMEAPFKERSFRVQLTFGGPELTVSVLKTERDEAIMDAIIITLSQIPEALMQGQ